MSQLYSYTVTNNSELEFPAVIVDVNGFSVLFSVIREVNNKTMLIFFSFF